MICEIDDDDDVKFNKGTISTFIPYLVHFILIIKAIVYRIIKNFNVY